jgi:hypothetical protein
MPACSLSSNASIVWHHASALAVVDLAQIQHVPLHRPAARNPVVPHNAPITVLLAVLAAKLVAQKHNASLAKPLAVSQGVGRHRTRSYSAPAA